MNEFYTADRHHRLRRLSAASTRLRSRRRRRRRRRRPRLRTSRRTSRRRCRRRCPAQEADHCASPRRPQARCSRPCRCRSCRLQPVRRCHSRWAGQEEEAEQARVSRSCTTAAPAAERAVSQLRSRSHRCACGHRAAQPAQHAAAAAEAEGRHHAALLLLLLLSQRAACPHWDQHARAGCPRCNLCHHAVERQRLQPHLARPCQAEQGQALSAQQRAADSLLRLRVAADRRLHRNETARRCSDGLAVVQLALDHRTACLQHHRAIAAQPLQ